MSTFMPRKQWITLGVIILLLCLLVGLRPALAASTILVDNLQPSAGQQRAVEASSPAYIGPSDYGYVSPGATALYDGNCEAGIIKAGLAPGSG